MQRLFTTSRPALAGTLAVLVALSSMLFAVPLRAQNNNPTIGEIVANPGQYYDRVVTLRGNSDRYVDDNEFLLADETGRIVVDPGPAWYRQISIPVDTVVTVTGEIDRMRNGQPDLDACRIVTPVETIEIRDCDFDGPPPWAGGPRNRGDEGRGEGRDKGRGGDDDFYGIIQSRPTGTSGTWVIGGRSFLARHNTPPHSDDGPPNLGTRVSVDYEKSRAFEIESEPARDCIGSGAAERSRGFGSGTKLYLPLVVS